MGYRKRRQRTLLLQLLIFYLLVLLFPAVMGVILYTGTVKSESKRIENETSAEVDQAAEVILMIHLEVQRITQHVTADKSLLEIGMDPVLLTRSHIARAIDFARYNQLIPYGLLNQYLRGYYVLFLDSAAAIGPDVVISMYSFYSHVFSLEGVNLEQWVDEFVGQYQENRYLAERQAVFDSLVDAPVLLHLHSIGSRTNPAGTAVAILDAGRINSVLSRIDLTEGGAVILMDEDGRLLMEATEEAPRLYRKYASDTGLNNARDAGFLAFRSPVGDSGLVLYAVLPQRFVTVRTAHIRTISAAIFAALLIAGVIVAFALAIYSSKPILSVLNSIRERVGDQDIENGATLARLESAYQTLITRTGVAAETLRIQNYHMHSILLHRLLKGTSGNEEHLVELLSGSGINLEGLQHTVAALQMSRKIDNQSADLPHVATAVIPEIVRERFPDLIFCEVGECSIALFFSTDISDNASFIAQIEPVVRSVVSCIKEQTGINPVIGIGRPRYAVREIYRCFHEATVAVESHTFENGSEIVWYKDDVSAEPFFYPWELEERILTCVRNVDRESLKEILDEIERENFRERALSGHMRSLLWTCMVSTLIRAHSQTSYGTGEFLAKVLPEPEEIMDQSVSFIAILKPQFDELMDIVEQSKSNQRRQLYERIASYIADNFSDKNMSLISIADRYQFSEFTFSRLFKELFRVNFHNYLESVRFNYATGQMKGTRKALKEIAFESGYASINTFSKAFKRHFGVSPTEYRRSISAEGE